MATCSVRTCRLRAFRVATSTTPGWPAQPAVCRAAVDQEQRARLVCERLGLQQGLPRFDYRLRVRFQLGRLFRLVRGAALVPAPPLAPPAAFLLHAPLLNACSCVGGGEAEERTPLRRPALLVRHRSLAALPRRWTRLRWWQPCAPPRCPPPRYRSPHSPSRRGSGSACCKRRGCERRHPPPPPAKEQRLKQERARGACRRNHCGCERAGTQASAGR